LVKRFLVTGCAGFIGQALVRRLLERDFDVVGLDNLSTGSSDVIKEFEKQRHFSFIKGDIQDISLCRTACHNVDFVLHHAALTSVQGSIINPRLYHTININGTFNMLMAASEKKVQRFIFPSSASVYGDIQPAKKKEDMLPSPKSPYAVQKLACEHYCQWFADSQGLNTVVFRYFNVYGPGQSPHSQYSGVISKFIEAFQNKLEPKLFGNGKQTRDFIFIDDVVEANISSCLNNVAYFGRPINIASGTATSLNHLLETLGKLTKFHPDPQIFPEREGDIQESLADISLAKRCLRFYPEIKLIDGLHSTLSALEAT
jgi:UDP-N-acetylglucosamine 4-epimerase